MPRCADTKWSIYLCDTREMLKKGFRLDPDFRKLWIGQAISQIGSNITGVALPLTAVLVLKASPLQMGFLS
jgi:hypothetical protein